MKPGHLAALDALDEARQARQHPLVALAHRLFLEPELPGQRSGLELVPVPEQDHAPVPGPQELDRQP